MINPVWLAVQSVQFVSLKLRTAFMLQVVILLLIFLDILLEKQRIWESLLITIKSVIEMYGEITLPPISGFCRNAFSHLKASQFKQGT